jgi:hypothetical protein
MPETESAEVTIYPTHNCFDDAVDWLNMLALGGASREELMAYVIVHGVIIAPDGQRLAHAWLEHDGQVLEGGIHHGERVWIEYPLADFRRLHAVEEETRYTIVDAERLDREFGPGPWKPEYRALCSGKRRAWALPKEESCER